jgi:hypothetical protein
MQLFMAVQMTPSVAGDIADLSASSFSYPWQLPTSFLSLAINLSLVSIIVRTGDKLFTGINETGNY